MTQKEDEAAQKPTATQPAQPTQPIPGEHGTSGQPGTVSDDQVSADGTGRHGRPSDDSDPGHS